VFSFGDDMIVKFPDREHKLMFEKDAQDYVHELIDKNDKLNSTSLTLHPEILCTKVESSVSQMLEKEIGELHKLSNEVMLLKRYVSHFVEECGSDVLDCRDGLYKKHNFEYETSLCTINNNTIEKNLVNQNSDAWIKKRFLIKDNTKIHYEVNGDKLYNIDSDDLNPVEFSCQKQVVFFKTHIYSPMEVFATKQITQEEYDPGIPVSSPFSEDAEDLNELLKIKNDWIRLFSKRN
jgi:hypothetical protein